jgi:hypothetical protein
MTPTFLIKVAATWSNRYLEIVCLTAGIGCFPPINFRGLNLLLLLSLSAMVFIPNMVPVI